MVDEDGNTLNARYDNFKISDEDNGYALSLGKFTGTILGDGMRDTENMKFTTFDHDNDNYDYANCAVENESGWWYKHCYYSYLNAPYEDLSWEVHDDNIIDLKKVKMLIRPKEAMKK
ncbi:fibrinogen-like protein 1 [Drosophila nasuta]|uniref:fibrinogen-like protein 1 n=1 Tax=Drosophila nasuta TaxID=42062 RepID=UPI00295EB3CE|nr:fibrinogen-like protein 1 [Drosophila nasuta]